MNQSSLNEKIRVSYGTAIILGLIEAKQDVAPTTAYLLWDEGCVGSCSFCPRANGNSKTRNLSRIVWPEFDFFEVVSRLTSEPRPFSRVCLQTGFKPDVEEKLVLLAGELLRNRLTTSVTLCPSQAGLAEKLLSMGIDHIGIGLDGASEESYREHKKKSWQRDWPCLMQLLSKYPKKIEVHLIFGLGDSEETFCDTIFKIVQAGGMISLFALTPVNGGSAPDLKAYRRMQIFRYLVETKGLQWSNFSFSDGKLTSFNGPAPELKKLLDNGTCFRTSGCGNCNRPYYNERPGQKFFNFPRPLTEDEFTTALEESGVFS